MNETEMICKYQELHVQCIWLLSYFKDTDRYNNFLIGIINQDL